MLRILSILCAMFMWVNIAFADSNKPFVQLDVYTINDLHGQLREEQGYPGVARLAGVIDAFMKENPAGSVLIGGGDMFSGSIDANEYKGMPSVMVMNEMGFAADCVGNHLYDYGMNVIKEQAALARFPLLSCNIINTSTQSIPTEFKPYVIIKRGGLNIGIVGITTEETAKKAHSDNLKGIKVINPIQPAQFYVNEARKKGADIVILLAHLGAEQNGKTIGGEIIPVIDALNGIDAVITGHSETVVEGEYKGIPVVQAGDRSEYLGRIRLLYSRPEKKIVASGAQVYEVQALPRVESGKVKKFVEPILKDVDAKYNFTLANNYRELANDRNGESAVGEYFCDLLQMGFKADVVLFNGGGVRNNLAQGPVTLRHLMQIFPFQNDIVVTELQGKDVKKALEHGIGNKNISRLRFAGLNITMDITQPEGKRIKNIAFSDGRLLEDDVYYKVVTNDFMMSGGDGFTMLQNGKNIRTMGKVNDFFAYALRASKIVNYEGPDGRLKIN